MRYSLFNSLTDFCSSSLLLPFFLENSLKKPGVTTFSKCVIYDFKNDVTPGFFKEFLKERGRSNEDEQKSVRELNRLYKKILTYSFE